MGGDRHHPLVVAVAEGLVAVGVAALRLDLHRPGCRRRRRPRSRLADDLRAEVDVDRLLLVGYSWGSVVSALPRRPVGWSARVLVAPPVAMFDLARPRMPPRLLLVPAHDQYGGPEAVRPRSRDRPDATVEVVDGADHFLAGAVARIADRPSPGSPTSPESARDATARTGAIPDGGSQERTVRVWVLLA